MLEREMLASLYASGKIKGIKMSNIKIWRENCSKDDQQRDNIQIDFKYELKLLQIGNGHS